MDVTVPFYNQSLVKKSTNQSLLRTVDCDNPTLSVYRYMHMHHQDQLNCPAVFLLMQASHQSRMNKLPMHCLSSPPPSHTSPSNETEIFIDRIIDIRSAPATHHSFPLYYDHHHPPVNLTIKMIMVLIMHFYLL